MSSIELSSRSPHDVYLQISNEPKRSKKSSQMTLAEREEKSLTSKYMEEGFLRNDAQSISAVHVKAHFTAKKVNEIENMLEKEQKKYWLECYGLEDEINKACTRITGTICCITTIYLIGGIFSSIYKSAF